MHLFKKILKWFGVFFIVGFLVLFVIRWFHIRDLDRTELQVQKIHATKLQLADVMGENLPPDPGAQADATIAGVDANENGIRDDVELAIFKAYPNSAKTRAVLLQYALALQMETIQPIVNTSTVTEVVREQSRAYACIGEIVSRIDSKKFDQETDNLTDFAKTRQLNTQARKDQRSNFLEYVRSYSELKGCDIDYKTLPN
jgi:hypothetical protein